MSKRLLWGLIGVAALATFALLGAGQSDLWRAIFPASGAYTNDLEAIDVRLTDRDDSKTLRLRIPKAYMTRSRNWRGGEQEVVYLETRLPEMRPARASPDLVGVPGSAEYKAALSEYKNGIYVRLRNMYVDPKSQYALSTAERVRSSLLERGYKLTEADFYGLEIYSKYAHGCPSSGKQCELPQVEELMTSGAGDEFVHFRCVTSEKNYVGDRFGCTGTTFYRGFSISCTFRYSELKRWREFDRKVRQLLDSFLIAA